MNSKTLEWQRVKAIFQTLSERPEGEWELSLRGLDPADAALADEVRALLDAHREGGGAIASALVRATGLLTETPTARDRAGQRIGPYSLLRSLGEGGMGEVWLAERADDAFHKQVAVKLVRSGLIARDALGRFQTEREALARLEHPNIVRLLDAGTSDEGVPYFVMEYVNGEPIEQYCEARSVSLRDRLRLFAQVCSAVEEAHRSLIVHRDIKPGNVLVTAEGTVKLLDFGIAKLLDPESGSNLLTRTAAVPATPAFASPEQLAGRPVTTATDVYALGILIYRLITGQHPYALDSDALAEVARVIRDTMPSRPSLAVSVAAVPEGADSRLPLPSRAARRSWSRELRGDLDNITLTALRKEPSRRYGSAALLSQDVGRFLDGLPVSATPDSVRYRTGKFVRRHVAGVAAAAVIAISLVAGLLATAHEARIARDERDRARLEKTKAERINAFLQQMLASANPSWYSSGYGKRGDTRVVDVLKQAESKVDTEISEYPEVRAELHQTIGNTYLGLGLVQPAERHFQAAVALYTSLHGEEHPKTAESLYYLGAARLWNGDLTGAEGLFRRSIAILRRVDPENANLPYILQDLANTRLKADPGAPGDAESLLRQALSLSRVRFGEEHPATRAIYRNLGHTFYQHGDLDRAEQIARDVVEKSRRSNDRGVLSGELSHLGDILEKKGNYALAELADREAFALVQELFGESHPNVAHGWEVLAEIHCRQRRYALAEKEARAALAIWRQALPDTPMWCVPSWTFLGEALVRTGRPAEATRYLTEALAALGARKNPDEPARASVEGLLAECRVAQSRARSRQPSAPAHAAGAPTGTASR